MNAIPSGMAVRVARGLSWYSNARIVAPTSGLASASDECDTINTVRFVRRCP